MYDVNPIMRIKFLVRYLNERANEYYNLAAPTISDKEYDKLFDELQLLEASEGIILSNSPTQHVGAVIRSGVSSVEHKDPLLSLKKTKSEADIKKMLKEGSGYLSLKLDGLTTKLEYEQGKLIRASTRGDGHTGEDVTANLKTFVNVPIQIPYLSRLVIEGESFVTTSYLQEEQKKNPEKSNGMTARNIASGALRLHNSEECKKKKMRFIPFGVKEGLSDMNSKVEQLDKLQKIGFSRITSIEVNGEDSEESILTKIHALKNVAIARGFPIDGIVFCYDDIKFGKSLGATNHHFKSGIAYKFEDEKHETTFRKIEWSISKNGELSPVGIFDKVTIDGTEVQKATLIGRLQKLKLRAGDKILVSKRNMIIPCIEENLSAANREDDEVSLYPKTCPYCNTSLKLTDSTLRCENKNCTGRTLQFFVHFCSKQAMNITGLSEKKIQKLKDEGFLKLNTPLEIYSLPSQKAALLNMEGMKEKGVTNLINAIDASKTVKFSNFLVSLGVPRLSSSLAKEISGRMDIKMFDDIIVNKEYNKLKLGDAATEEIENWFKDESNMNFYNSLKNTVKTTT